MKRAKELEEESILMSMRKTGGMEKLGAMRFPSSDILLNLFIEKFNLPMNTIKEYNPNTYYYVNNVLAKTKDVEKNISLLKFNLTAEELALNSFS